MTENAPKPVRFDPNSYFNINLKADLERLAAQGMTKTEAIKHMTTSFKVSGQSCRVVINHHGLKFREPVALEKISIAMPKPLALRATELAGIRQIPLEELIVASVEQVLADHGLQAGGA